jgi:hypothetical protein
MTKRGQKHVANQLGAQPASAAVAQQHGIARRQWRRANELFDGNCHGNSI